MLKNIFVLASVCTFTLSFGADATKRPLDDAENIREGKLSRLIANIVAEVQAEQWTAECPNLSSAQATLYRNTLLALIDNPAFQGLEEVSVPGRIYSLGGALGSDSNPLSLTSMSDLKKFQLKTKRTLGDHNFIPFTGRENPTAISWLLAKINPALPTVFADQRTFEHQGRSN